jgi:hypothetical protein
MSQHEQDGRDPLADLIDDLLALYSTAGREVKYMNDRGEIKPYWPHRYLQAVRRAIEREEVVEFVERLVTRGDASRGFGYLEDAGRLDLTVEALVVDESRSYHRLFAKQAVEASAARLEEARQRAEADPPAGSTEGEDHESDALSDEQVAEIGAREAAHGKKMIEVKIRFWTNDLSGEKGKIRPKHAWGSGVVRIEGNDAHGITPTTPVPFNSMADIPAKIEAVLIDHGVTIHPSSRMRRYMR